MVRYIAPVFVGANGARAVGVLSGPVSKPVIVKSSVPFKEATFRPGKRVLVAPERYETIPTTVAVVVEAALNPVPPGWVLDQNFTEIVQYDLIDRWHYARGRKTPRSVAKPADEIESMY